MPGATRLHGSGGLERLLREQKAAGRWIGAICASPAVVLQAHGLLDGVERGKDALAHVVFEAFRWLQ
jgi:4-methyl-5(b-hydroxyethyl)-thiazole monophosphate biosynthesis